MSAEIFQYESLVYVSGDLSGCETSQKGEEKENTQTSAKPNPPLLYQGNIITSNYKVIKSDQL